MKLNTKLGIGKKPQRQEPALQELQNQIKDLATQVRRISTPEAIKVVERVEVPVIKKPKEFALDIRRDRNGYIESVLARDKETGSAFYNFSVRRDRDGNVNQIAATPH